MGQVDVDTHVNFFNRQIPVKLQNVIIQYHVRITVSRYFMNIPEHSIGHQNSCIVINQQWLLWNERKDKMK